MCVVQDFSPRIAYDYNTLSIRHILDPSANVHTVYDILVLIGSESSKGSGEFAPYVQTDQLAFAARIHRV